MVLVSIFLVWAMMGKVDLAGTHQMCYDCTDIPYPRDCDRVVDCGPDSMCYTESFVTGGGIALYNTGCRSAQRCKYISRRSEANVSLEANDDLLACAECCEEDFCNSKGCGADPLPDRNQRGPVCFNCHQHERADSCVSVNVCDKNEQCLLRSYETTGTKDLLFSSGCVYNTICEKLLPVSVPSLAVGRRDIASCTGCCEGDFCNRDCASLHTVHNKTDSTSLQQHTDQTTTGTKPFVTTVETTTPSSTTTTTTTTSTTTTASTTSVSPTSTTTITTVPSTITTSGSAMPTKLSTPNTSEISTSSTASTIVVVTTTAATTAITVPSTVSTPTSTKPTPSTVSSTVAAVTTAATTTTISTTDSSTTTSSLTTKPASISTMKPTYPDTKSTGTVHTSTSTIPRSTRESTDEPYIVTNPMTTSTTPTTTTATTPTTSSSTTTTTTPPSTTTTSKLTSTSTNKPTSFAEVCNMKGYDYDAADGVCYKIDHGEGQSWAGARQKCKENSSGDLIGDLIIFRTKAEEIRFVGYARALGADIDYWVGASDIHQERVWVWVDGSHLNPLDYFIPYQPDNENNNEDCGALTKLSAYPYLPTLMNDAPCGHKTHFICELRLREKQNSGPCRNKDYTHHSKTGICYKIYNQLALPQHEARKHCQSESADLLMLRNQTTEALFQILYSYDRHPEHTFWLGAERISGDKLNSKTSSFVWYNGRPFDHSLQWSTGEPNNKDSNENCVDLLYLPVSYFRPYHPYESFALNDNYCGRAEYFICEERCPDNTYTYDSTLGLCYKVYTDHVTWNEAKSRCARDDKSGLLELRNQNELDFFTKHASLLGQTQYWVGATYDYPSRNYEWSTLGYQVPVSYWRSSQIPTSNHGNCAYMSYYTPENRAALSNHHCNTRLSGFVCQHIW